MFISVKLMDKLTKKFVILNLKIALDTPAPGKVLTSRIFDGMRIYFHEIDCFREKINTPNKMNSHERDRGVMRTTLSILCILMKASINLCNVDALPG